MKVKNIQLEDIDPKEALQEFLLVQKAQGKSEATLQDYEYHNKILLRRCKTWEEIPKNAREYLAEVTKNNTYNLRLKNLKAFLQFAEDEGYLPENPLKGYKQKRVESRIVNIEEEALKKLLEAPDKKTFVGLRDYALMLLALDTGIRPKETLHLEKGDICFKQNLVNVKSTTSKTRVARSLPISSITARTINKLIINHHEAWKTNLIFTTHEGKQMNKNTWSRRLEKYSKEIGTKIKPYDLRHSFALYYLRAEGDVFSLQKMMGHSNLSMTQKYLSLTDDDIKEKHACCSPLNTITKAKRIKKL